ncbi:hypothetical protein Bca4012_065366 [Brassica carinata]
MAASGTVATLRTSVSIPPSSSSSSSQLTHLRSPSKVPLKQRPDLFGRFGKLGGKYIPETLMHALFELKSPFHSLAIDGDFQREFAGILKDYVGRTAAMGDETQEALMQVIRDLQEEMKSMRQDLGDRMNKIEQRPAPRPLIRLNLGTAQANPS